MDTQNQQQRINDEAWGWIAKLSGDQAPGAEEIQQLHQWMAQSDSHHQTLKRLSQAWDDMDVLSALAVPHRQRSSITQLISGTLAWLLSPLLLLWLSLKTTVAYSVASPARFVTASVALACTVSLALWLNTQNATAVYITKVGQQQTHQLPDGSVLNLNTNSKVAIAYKKDRREIVLHHGEAHFDVKPDKTRPFDVYAGTRIVRAVGTAFSVYLIDDRVEVTVAEGKVAVAVQSSPQPETEFGIAHLADNTGANPGQSAPQSKNVEVLGSLVAGQSVVIPPGPKGAMDNITDDEKQHLKRRLSWLEGQLIYAGEGLGEVINDISRYTPVYIELADPALKDIRMGGQFKVGETDALFRVLEVGFGLTVTRLSDYHVKISQSE